MKIGIICHPTYGGSGAIATELGKALAAKGHTVHNGIIENYLELKESLQKEGHKFVSETDTEIIAHLIEKFYQNRGKRYRT